MDSLRIAFMTSKIDAMIETTEAIEQKARALGMSTNDHGLFELANQLRDATGQAMEVQKLVSKIMDNSVAA